MAKPGTRNFFKLSDSKPLTAHNPLDTMQRRPQNTTTCTWVGVKHEHRRLENIPSSARNGTLTRRATCSTSGKAELKKKDELDQQKRSGS